MRLLERERIEPAGQMKERKHRLQIYLFLKHHKIYKENLPKTEKKNYDYNPDKLVFTHNFL